MHQALEFAQEKYKQLQILYMQYQNYYETIETHEQEYLHWKQGEVDPAPISTFPEIVLTFENQENTVNNHTQLP